jgi:hypothetical protein
MGQYEITEFFLREYEKDPKEYFTAKQVAKAMNSDSSKTSAKLFKLFLFGYLVKDYKPSRRKGIFYYNCGNLYRLNPRVVNTLKLIFHKTELKSRYSSISEQKNTNISVNNFAEKEKGTNGGSFNDTS